MVVGQSDQSASSYSKTSKNDLRAKRLPDFLCIGTQKGGTTTLHYLLAEDERVGLPSNKEIHYFDQSDLMPIEWYSQQFSQISDYQAIGEITPYYMYHPLAAKRIKQTIPDVKLLALLRDPVERTISQYFHAVRNGYEQEDISKAIGMEDERIASGSKYSHQKHSYVARSRYNEQLDRYYELFPNRNILIIKSEDLFSKPDKCYSEIQSFLGLIPKKRVNRLPKINKGNGESKTVDENTRKKIRGRLENTYNILEKKYGISWD